MGDGLIHFLLSEDGHYVAGMVFAFGVYSIATHRVLKSLGKAKEILSNWGLAPRLRREVHVRRPMRKLR